MNHVPDTSKYHSKSMVVLVQVRTYEVKKVKLMVLVIVNKYVIRIRIIRIFKSVFRQERAKLL